MDQFKLVLWSLFFTLLIPLLVWTGLFSIFGWKLFLLFFVIAGLLFYFQDKMLKSSYFQGMIQMLIPFALTFRFYDALRAGKEKSQDEGNIFQVLWATSRGFLKSNEEAEEETGVTRKGRSQRERNDDHDDNDDDKRSAQQEAKAAFSKVDTPTSAPPKARPAPPKPVDLDAELAQLKKKMATQKQSEKVTVPIPESSE